MDVRHTVVAGMTFGRLTTEELIQDPKRKDRRWLCRCVCGKRTIVLERALKSGDIKSCGCARKRFDVCQKTDCRYQSETGCSYFIVQGHTRTSLHVGENVDINHPCREYSPGPKVLLNVQPFKAGKDLLE